MAKKHSRDVIFEDSLHDDWSRDADILEVPIGRQPLSYLGLAIAALALIVAGRVIFLNFANGNYDAARAAANAAASSATPAPRGLMYDREGDVLADNQAAFAAVLDAHTFLSDTVNQSGTLSAIQNIFGIAPADVWALVASSSAQDFASSIVLSEAVTQGQLVQVQALSLPAIKTQSHFQRVYPEGQIFSSVVGYTGRPTGNDLSRDPSLTEDDSVGKAGLELYYDQSLRGTPGNFASFRNARGQTLGDAVDTPPTIGASLHLTIDGGLQAYFYNRIQVELAKLNRTTGLGIAMDPQTGAILALVNVPGYDNNVFASGTSAQISQLFTSPAEPLFNRAVAGMYNPGSTIKPLDAVAGLKDGIVTPDRTVFSPGYLMVPNPYNSSTPTKYLDWQYQGAINLDSAIAQSSDVYFYLVGGGSPVSTPELNDPRDYGISGLGIDVLHEWWQTFGLGSSTGIDLPGEAGGFLPTPAWKKKTSGTPWLLGDTYNVSIGQGDLLLTPLQLLDYISAVANGGKLYRPYLDSASTPELRADLTSLAPQIAVVEGAMRDTVTMPRGTAYTTNNLPFPTCAKTGSAQIHNNTEENALYVGYGPCPNVASDGTLIDPSATSTTPQIAILILIENSVQGSLNAVPIARDVLNWYYQNRMTAESGE